MKKIQTESAKTDKDVKGIFKKMVMDKREMHAYIQANGTLKGFKGNNVKFAKPL